MGIIWLLFGIISIPNIEALNAERCNKISNAPIIKQDSIRQNSTSYPLSNVTGCRDLKSSVKSRALGALLPVNTFAKSASKYVNSIKILFSSPFFPTPSSSDIRMTFLRGLVVPVFISTILMTNTFYNYLEENWAFQGHWNGLNTKDLTTIALTIHLIHSLFKLFVLRGFFIANLTNLRCPVKDYFYPTKKSLMARIVEWNPQLITNILGFLSVGITAASLYVGVILAETGWGTAHPILKVGDAIAYFVTLASMFKSLYLKQDFSSLVNINHYITPIAFRSDIKKKYVLSKLFKTTAELPEEYKSVMLSQSQIKLISILATVVPFSNIILKLFPTCLETFSMLFLLSVNLNNLSMAGIFTSVVHAVALLIENIIHRYDRHLLIKDIDNIYKR